MQCLGVETLPQWMRRHLEYEPPAWPATIQTGEIIDTTGKFPLPQVETPRSPPPTLVRVAPRPPEASCSRGKLRIRSWHTVLAHHNRPSVANPVGHSNSHDLAQTRASWSGSRFGEGDSQWVSSLRGSGCRASLLETCTGSSRSATASCSHRDAGPGSRGLPGHSSLLRAMERSNSILVADDTPSTRSMTPSVSM